MGGHRRAPIAPTPLEKWLYPGRTLAPSLHHSLAQLVPNSPPHPPSPPHPRPPPTSPTLTHTPAQQILPKPWAAAPYPWAAMHTWGTSQEAGLREAPPGAGEAEPRRHKEQQERSAQGPPATEAMNPRNPDCAEASQGPGAPPRSSLAPRSPSEGVRGQVPTYPCLRQADPACKLLVGSGHRPGRY